jgi:hypothetical protein
MTYSVSGLIQAVDYNTFAQGGAAPDANVANINTIWGTGTLDKGWGQSTTLSAVSAAGTVTATQWADMFSRFTSIASQTNTTVTAISNPTVGDTIAVKNNFSTNLTSCFANRNNAVAAGTTITSGGVTTYTQDWQRSLTTTHTITFASANAARYFFNAGGRITWAGARSSGSATSKNTAWSNLLTACGTLNITTGTSTQTIAGTSYTGTTKTGGSGTPTTLLTTIGFYDLTTSNQEIFKQFDATYLYTSDFVSVNIKADAAAGSATVITITVLYQNAVSGIDGLFETVDGTTTSTITAIQPSTTYLTNTWGTPTLASTASGYDVAYLVVAGGAGGSSGGGGAGGVLSGTARLLTGSTYTITVGAGSAGAITGQGPGGGGITAPGSNSFFGTIYSTGGGGSSYDVASNKNGGSGGGGNYNAGTGGTGITGQGFAGGSVTGSTGGGGGGGGASAAGASVATSATGGAGGAGVSSAITGSAVTYGGGGGGGGTTGGAGGSGGGGAGANSGPATNGTANFGGGGGGIFTAYPGGNGGSGVVILSIPTASYTGTTTGTPTVTTSGANTILKYTTSGTYTS